MDGLHAQASRIGYSYSDDCNVVRLGSTKAVATAKARSGVWQSGVMVTLEKFGDAWRVTGGKARDHSQCERGTDY
jgi:hypothetical protein